jgi:hypothetical protein
MGMYIYPCDQHGVVSWVDGYVSGAKGRCKFTELQTEELTERHRIKSNSALGWPRSVEIFAEKRDISWLEAFTLASSPIITRFLEPKRSSDTSKPRTKRGQKRTPPQ